MRLVGNAPVIIVVITLQFLFLFIIKLAVSV